MSAHWGRIRILSLTLHFGNVLTFVLYPIPLTLKE
jgi:hypothetical protein